MVDLMQHYISPQLVQLIVDQVNLYTQQKEGHIPKTVTKHACNEQWKPVTTTEMEWFFGLMFLTVLIQKPLLEWYWSTRGMLLTLVFSQTIVRNKFQITQRYLTL
jgi:hypothetical protein